jgi:hypothetical protein
MEVEGEEKRGKRSKLICLCDDWIAGNSIGHDPLIYIEGVVLSQYKTSPRLIFQVSHVAALECHGGGGGGSAEECVV